MTNDSEIGDALLAVQVEGAFVMGLGYWLTEELDYDTDTGEVTTFNTWVYIMLQYMLLNVSSSYMNNVVIVDI